MGSLTVVQRVVAVAQIKIRLLADTVRGNLNCLLQLRYCLSILVSRIIGNPKVVMGSSGSGLFWRWTIAARTSGILRGGRGG